jgi:hypothetical protein
MSEKILGYCWYCGEGLDHVQFSRQARCPKCLRDTRTCKACTEYEPTAYNECRESESDRVVEKEKSNFCDYFKPHPVARATSSLDTAARAKQAAEALFKKK